jgi:hypothetical protein
MDVAGPNAERNGDDRAEREAAAAAQGSNGEPNIVNELANWASPMCTLLGCRAARNG